MPLLIDGYNLLHGSGVFGDGSGRTPLEDARNALLAFLIDSVEPGLLRGSAIVFDAQSAPPGLPTGYTYHGLMVHFAPRSGTADEMIEELIADHHAPRSLVVVSSDHRVQRAAKRRKATAIDSDQWYRETITAKNARRRAPKPAPVQEGSTSVTPTSAEVRRWLAEFGLTDDDLAELEMEHQSQSAASAEPTTAEPAPKPRTPRAAARKASPSEKPKAKAKEPAPRARRQKPAKRHKPSSEEVARMDLRNPFPRGYGHDLLDE